MKSLALVLVLCSLPAYSASRLLEIPYSKQHRSYTCGHNSLRMVLGYWGERVSRMRIIFWLGSNGTTAKSFEDWVKGRGGEYVFEYRKSGFGDLKASLDARRPIFVGLNAGYLKYLNYETTGGHFIVIVGYDDQAQRLYVRDPNTPYIETLKYSDFKKAIKGRKRNIFTIHRRDAKHVPAAKIEHFNDAKPFGAKKEKPSGFPLALLIPSVHFNYESLEGKSVGEGIESGNFEETAFYHINWNGITYGHSSIETSPFLGNGKRYGRMVSASLAFIVSGLGLRLGASEQVSPGVYSYGRQRSLNIKNYSATKQIPALLYNQLVVEASGFMDADTRDELSYEPLNMYVSRIGGGRVGVRQGLNPMLGYMGAGVSYNEMRVNMDALGGGTSGQFTTLAGMSYDVTLGPLRGGYQSVSQEEGVIADDSGLPMPGIDIESYDIGIDYNLGQLRSSLSLLTLLNYTGIMNPYLEYHYERVRIHDSRTDQYIATKTWNIELPVHVRYIDLAYGFRRVEIDSNATLENLRSAWVRIYINSFLPYAQLQAGYKVDYESFDELVGQSISAGAYVGM